jgi:tRNA1(Val) A37 N6-methylase TrmN6
LHHPAIKGRNGIHGPGATQKSFCHHLVRVKTRSDKREKRVMMEFDRHFGFLHDEVIIIREEDEGYSKEYAELTSDYYISLK